MRRAPRAAPPAARPACRTRVVLAAAALLLRCAHLQELERPPSPGPLPPPPSVVATVGYDDALRLGAAWAQARGYQVALLEAQRRDALWWLRYRVVREGLEGELSLQVDPSSGRLQLLQDARADAPAP